MSGCERKKLLLDKEVLFCTLNIVNKSLHRQEIRHCMVWLHICRNLKIDVHTRSHLSFPVLELSIECSQHTGQKYPTFVHQYSNPHSLKFSLRDSKDDSQRSKARLTILYLRKTSRESGTQRIFMQDRVPGKRSIFIIMYLRRT